MTLFGPVLAIISRIIVQAESGILLFFSVVFGALVLYQVLQIMLSTMDSVEGRQKRHLHIRHLWIIGITGVVLIAGTAISANFLTLIKG